VLGIASLCLHNCIHPPWHTFNQILTHFLPNSLPFLLYPFPQLSNSLWWLLILCKLLFEVIPQILYGIEIWGLRGPYHSVEIMVFEPILGLLAGVLGVIVLLKHHILHSFTSILQAILQLILQNADIKVCIHPAINLAGIPHTIPAHTAPHHQGSTSKLLGPFHQPITEALPWLLPHPFPSI
ncbi:uncharacterized protein LAESUDRAFT_795612, partial [Laetiporus sulphureus 93-53]